MKALTRKVNWCKSMYDLSKTSMISIEIGTKCNMKDRHKECPINYRKIVNKRCSLTVSAVNENIITQAKKLNFSGYFAFHLFNEPMLDVDLILKIIEMNPTEKYLLWTNGTLLRRNVEGNDYLKKFKMVCITCYDKVNMPFYKLLNEHYGNIKIFPGIMDDRMDIYTREHENHFSCKKPLFELVIDHYGNILLCTFDYDNTYSIGNVFDVDLVSIVNSKRYQNILKFAHFRILDQKECPEICKKCIEPWITYPHYFDL